MKKFRNLVVLLLIAVVLSSSAYAEDPIEPLVLTKAEFQQLAVEKSAVLAGLRVQKEGLMDQESQIDEAASKIKDVLDLLPAYKALEDQYRSNSKEAGDAEPELSSEFREYVYLLSKAISTGLDETEGPRLVELAGILTAGGVTGLMTVEEYGALSAYRDIFRAFGVFGSDISGEDMYNTFLYPIHVLPAQLSAAVDNVILAIDATEAGIRAGAGQLFDAVLFLESMMALQEEGTELSKSSFEGTTRKWELGLASDMAQKSAEADYIISDLETKSFGRDIDNLTMNMNGMIRRNLTDPLVLDGTIEERSVSGTVDVLVEKALENRSEILSIQNDMKAKNKELDTMEGYIPTDSTRYRTVNKEYKQLLLNWEETKTDIKKDIYIAYRDMLYKMKSLELAELELESAAEQYRQMEVNHSLGFITDDTLDAAGMGLIQAENAVVEARRDYYDVIDKIEQAAGVGPGYTNGGFGL